MRMRQVRAVLAGFFLVLLAPGLARADVLRLERAVNDGVPVRGCTRPGGGLILTVGGLPEGVTAADLEARLGKHELLVTAIDEAGVRVRLLDGDDAPEPGRHELWLLHAGDRSNAIEVEVLSAEAFAAAHGQAREGALTARAARTARERFARRLRIDRFEIELGDDGARVTVGGPAELPDGTRVLVRFLIAGDGDDRAIAQAKVRIADGRFERTFGPLDGDLLAAIYLAEARVDLAKDPRLRRRLPELLTAAEMRANEGWRRATLRATDLVEHGEREERERQLVAIRAHYGETVALVQSLIDELDLAYGAASRSVHREGSGGAVDEEEWLSHLRAHHCLRRDPGTGRDDPAWIDRLRADDRFRAEREHLDAEAWVAWVADEHLPAVADAGRRHETFVARWVAPAFPAAALRLGHLIAVLADLARTRTHALLTHHGLEPPEALRARPTSSPLPRSPQARAAYLREGLREVERVVGTD